MTQQIEELNSAETESSPESSQESGLDQREGMRALIAELVKTNQELRFRVARLKDTIERLEKGQRDEVPWAGMLI